MEPESIFDGLRYAVSAGQEPMLQGQGRWTAGAAAAIDRQISDVVAQLTPAGRIAFDMAGVEALDSYGALLVARLIASAEARGTRVEPVNMPDRYAGLVQAVREAEREAGRGDARPRATFTVTALVAGFAGAFSRVGADLLAILNLLGAVVQALGRILTGRAAFRFTSTVHQLDRVAWQAVPIVFLITFLIGGIIAQQGFFHFRKFGADQYVVDMVGILMLREIGVLLVAIMIAGRSGSSYTAELGSMKMREEIDALRTMGLDPVGVLILPRLIALVLALPALAFLGAMSALLGGGLVAWVYGDMNPHVFIARLRDAISITHFKVGIIKAPFMALVIGLVACVEGLRVRGSAESLGLQTTESVVKSIFLVIVLDGLFAMFFASVGM